MIRKLLLFPLLSLIFTGAPLVVASESWMEQGNRELFSTAVGERDIAKQAYVWGYPLLEAAKIRWYTTNPQWPTGPRKATEATGPINHFGHARLLADPSTALGPGANNDTMYSLAWMDLQGAQFSLKAPDYGDRYYTFHFAEDDSSAEHSIGMRTHGGKLPDVFISGPDFVGKAPDGVFHVQSKTRYMLIAHRILVNDGDDLADIYKLQDQIRLTRYGTGASSILPQEDLAGSDDDELQFLSRLGAIVKSRHNSTADKKLLASFSEIGLSENGFDRTALSSLKRAEVVAGLEDGKKLITLASQHLGSSHGGWSFNLYGPRFGDNLLLRAAVAKDQIFVTIPEEAVYPVARLDSDGNELTGKHTYQIDIPASQPMPAKAFWSITAYDDRGMMIANEINRYSIGDRTADLNITDSGVSVTLSSTKPTDPAVNWLPIPDGKFYLMMRLYVPDLDVLSQDSKWVPPAVKKL